jgi:PiT family inorganic phosphate transporter
MTFLYLIVALVLVFDLINESNDSANSIGTFVSTKILLPMAAVSMATFIQNLARNNSPFVSDKHFRRLQLLSTAFYSLGNGTCDAQKSRGQKITSLNPFKGFCVETATELTLFVAIHLGIPVSTTHTITGAIIGVGSRKGHSAVSWGIFTKIFRTRILTIPGSGIFCAGIFLITNMLNIS